MIWLLIALIIFVLAVLEKLWADAAIKALRCKNGSTKVLVEPGQPLDWTATIENHSRLPIPFLRLQQTFPEQVEVVADAKWIETHCQAGIHLWHSEDKLALRPRQRKTRLMQLKIDRRGEYPVGAWRLSAGDILGFREAYIEGKCCSVVVMPQRSSQPKAIQAVSGFLGDISVRRFILEDPILTVGFRDYTGREPLKAVSWKRTAMTGSLQVKQYDHTAEQKVMILLNMEEGMPAQCEECFRLMRMVCEQLEQKKIPFGFRTNGNLPGPVGKLHWMADGLGESHLNKILYALGCADYTCYYSFETLIRQALRGRTNKESYILITPKVTQETQNLIRMLEASCGNRICVLSGDEEVTQ